MLRVLVAPAFRHHNPYFAGDAESLMRAMEENARQNPGKSLRIVHALEDGDLVAIHGHVKMKPSDRGIALVHVFRFEGDRIADARFGGQGCSISQASISMMTEILKGRTLDEALELEGKFLALMRGEEEPKRDRALGDLRALEGVSKLPVRIKCALLGWNALDEAIKAYRRSEEGVMGKKLEFEDLTSIPEGFDPAEHKEDLPS